MLRSISCMVVFVMFGLTSCSPVKTTHVRPDELKFSPLELVIPETKPVILPNGIRLYLVDDRELPMVHITGMIGGW